MSDRIAAIDCGTNSIRLLICEIDGGVKVDLVRELQLVRLGQDVDRTGLLADEAIERTLAATKEYADLIAEFDAARIRFCATSAVRDAANADQFADGVESALGVRPEILTGDQEARASFDGATRELNAERAAVIDLGGGSTEIVAGSQGLVTFATSLNIGCVRLTERFLASDPPSSAELMACSQHVDSVMAPAQERLRDVDAFVGVAGTVTTIAAHALRLSSYDADVLHLARIDLDEMRAACRSLMSMTVAERRALPFMHPGRADVIGGGALILDRFIDLLPAGAEAMVISEHDILDGIAWELSTEGA